MTIRKNMDEWQAMKYKSKRGTEYKHPNPKERKPEGKDQPIKKKKLSRKEYVSNVVTAHIKKNPTGSLFNLSEVGRLAEEQYDDDTNIVKQEKVCLSQI